ncbi:hypothetical protein Ciccas_014483 [Cichlidogyrus casuarinus]|uniref:Uncharacterized protein n=1 Tax=Cichlidogyrus casuarinus TaxID=1844966 RepID=A0ABD2PJ65_9PLAT
MPVVPPILRTPYLGAPMKTTDADGKITLCTDDTLVANTFGAHFASNFDDVTPSPPHTLQPTTPFTP